ncbi:hypothetical protein ABE484_08435 [Pseudomonas pudica]|uniref:hypothetical protein n=1 Tax=Pseudomonas TaxID=286 RepID=UPI0015B00151|nr:hypothetical protein [Pseudomonas sp. B10(2017)]
MIDGKACADKPGTPSQQQPGFNAGERFCSSPKRWWARIVIVSYEWPNNQAKKASSGKTSAVSTLRKNTDFLLGVPERPADEADVLISDAAFGRLPRNWNCRTFVCVAIGGSLGSWISNPNMRKLVFIMLVFSSTLSQFKRIQPNPCIVTT